MKIYYLSDKWSWLGGYSSYGRLPSYIRDAGHEAQNTEIKYGLSQRCMGRAYSIFHGWPWRRDSVFAAGEFRFLRRLSALNDSTSICHVLYFDNHHYLWERWKKSPKNMVCTIHHPPPRDIPPRMLGNLKRVSSAIVLTKRDLEFYESLIGRGNVRFIRHGVDTDFFYPDAGKYARPARLMFTGQNGRNVRMLYRVIESMAKRRPDLRFDLLVREERIKADGLERLLRHPSVVWRHDISDEELRGLYRASYLLLLPMNEMSANNAIVEALASGVPVVTTDVGGVGDYGGGSIYPIVANDDDDSMLSLIEKYLHQPSWRDEIAFRCRKFAEEALAWPLIAERHIKAYKDMLV